MAWTTENTSNDLMVFEHTMTSTASGNFPDDSSGVQVTTAAANTGFIVTIDLTEVVVPSANWVLILVDDFGTDLTNGNGTIPAGGILLDQAALGNGMPFSGVLDLSATGMGNAKQVTVTVYVMRYQ